MAQTNWQNLPSTSTPLNATNLNKIETAVYGTVLYDDANGTSSTITLNNDSFTNYDELEIMLNDFKFTKIKVVNQNTYFFQRFTIPTATTFRTFCTSITINNNTITFGTQYFYDHSGYFQEFPGIKILKIIGYKK